MRRKFVLGIICIAILVALGVTVFLNPSWKAQETLYDGHYVLQANGSSNGTVGSWHLTKGDSLNITTTVRTGQAVLLLDIQTVNPSLAATWERLVLNGTGIWQANLTVPVSDKYLINFLIYGNVTSASIDGKCTREYTQHVIP